MQYIVAVALLALVAVASATTAEFIDDFSFTTNEFGIFTGDFPGGNVPCTASSPCTKSSVVCDPSATTAANHITGGTREIKIVGYPTPSCSVTAVVYNGTFSGSVGGIGCGATITTRYDGSTNCALQNEAQVGSPAGSGYPGQFTESFTLGINLLNEGFAFQILARSDHPVPLRVTVWQSSTQSTQLGQTVQTPQNQVNQFQTYIFLFSAFNSQSVLANTGAIDFAFDVNDNIQCELAEFDVLIADTASLCGTVFGDCNCNLVQESGDASITGVSVSLSGSSTSSTTTGTNGQYCFTGLTTGVTYTVTVPSSLGLCAGAGNTNPRSVTVPTGGVTGVNFAVVTVGGTLQIPADVSVPCGSSTAPSSTGTATVTAGSCGSTGSVSFVDSVAAGNCANGGAISVISRTWSGAGTSKVQTITVIDSQVAPTLNAPASVTVPCGGSTNPSSTGTATAVQNGCTTVSVSFTDSGAGSSGCNVQTCTTASSFVRTFTATDLCGNTATPVTQTINIGSCGSTCPACPTCPPPQTIPVTVPVTVAPRPPVGPLNCKFICDDADSSSSVLAVSVALLALFALLL